MNHALGQRNEWVGQLAETRIAYKTAVQSYNQGLPLILDNHLFFDVGPNQTWALHGALYLECGVNNMDINYGFSVPTSARGWFAGLGLHETATNNVTMSCGARMSVDSWATFGVIVDFATVNMFHGLVMVGENPGRINLRWSQASSQSQPTRVVTGSYLIGERVE